MIEGAERRGELTSESVIIGNRPAETPAGAGDGGGGEGYRLIITMPETMSIERRKLLSALSGGTC